MIALLLGAICLLMLAAAAYLFARGMRKAGTDRVLSRLAQGQPQLIVEKNRWAALERGFLQAGLGRPDERMNLWLLGWAFIALLGWLIWSWFGLLAAIVLPPLGLRVFIAWRYRRRVRRMVEQLPTLLDYTVRSLKAGRTLADAVIGGISAAGDPLKGAMSRVERNVQLGVALPDAMHDFAELYERDEFRLFALGLKVNHRFGGNASELLENLIKLIREREQAARQLRAMTGETRVTAIVLALLPVSVAGYFLLANPAYLMNMWEDSGGQKLLLAAFSLQAFGCLALWRMMRSV